MLIPCERLFGSNNVTYSREFDLSRFQNLPDEVKKINVIIHTYIYIYTYVCVCIHIHIYI